MVFKPHDHRMWAVIGIYSGREENTFFRRAEQGLKRHGTKQLNAKVVQGAALRHRRYDARLRGLEFTIFTAEAPVAPGLFDDLLRLRLRQVASKTHGQRYADHEVRRILGQSDADGHIGFLASNVAPSKEPQVAQGP